MSININGWTVMPSHCPTCPFKPDKEGMYRDPGLAATVINRIWSKKASQVCHHPRHHGKPQTHLCRGARDHQLQIFYRMGWIEAETDEAWAKALETINQQE